MRNWFCIFCRRYYVNTYIITPWSFISCTTSHFSVCHARVIPVCFSYMPDDDWQIYLAQMPLNFFETIVASGHCPGAMRGSLITCVLRDGLHILAKQNVYRIREVLPSIILQEICSGSEITNKRNNTRKLISGLIGRSKISLLSLTFDEIWRRICAAALTTTNRWYLN